MAPHLGPEHAIRVLFVGSPATRGSRTVRDLLASQSDMELIEEPDFGGLRLLLLLKAIEPDVLVLQLGSSRIPGLSQVLGEYPHLIVLTISPDGRELELHRVKVESVTMSEGSLQNLAKTIRAAVEQDGLAD